MKKIVSFLMLILCSYVVTAQMSGGLGLNFNVQQGPPLIDVCNYSSDSVYRTGDYVFNGEHLSYTVLITDFDGTNYVSPVTMSIDGVSAYCIKSYTLFAGELVNPSCNSVISSSPSSGVMAYYDCEVLIGSSHTVDNANFTARNYHTGLYGYEDADELFFINPTVSISVPDTINFGDISAGTSKYSDPVVITSVVEAGSNVDMGVYISAEDLVGSGGLCPVSNVLELGDGEVDGCDDDNLCYNATNGVDSVLLEDIVYGDAIGDSYSLLGNPRVSYASGLYPAGSVLADGGSLQVWFLLNLPSPCTTSFSSANDMVYLWAEVI